MVRMASNGKEFVVSMEQVGPDVVIWVNGIAVLTFQANEGLQVGPEMVVFSLVAGGVGVTVRTEG